MLADGAPPSRPARLERELDLFFEHMPGSRDARAGVQAFADRVPPRFI